MGALLSFTPIELLHYFLYPKKNPKMTEKGASNIETTFWDVRFAMSSQ